MNDPKGVVVTLNCSWNVKYETACGRSAILSFAKNANSSSISKK